MSADAASLPPGRSWPGGAVGKAVAALVFAVAGASLVLVYRENLLVGLTDAIGLGDDPNLNFDLWFRIAIYGAIVLLALAGALIFGRLPAAGRTRNVFTLSALPAGVGAVALLIVVARFTGISNGNPAAMPLATAVFFTGMIVIALQVTAEEWLFRGILQPLLVQAWGGRTGVVLAALGFASVHFIGGWRDPISLLNISLAGIWFGLLALRTGGLLAPILAHFGYNWSEEMLFGASPNPGVSTFGSVVDIDLAGAPALGGSIEGFNASLVLSAVLLAMIAVLLILGRTFEAGGDDRNQVKQDKGGATVQR